MTSYDPNQPPPYPAQQYPAAQQTPGPAQAQPSPDQSGQPGAAPEPPAPQGGKWALPVAIIVSAIPIVLLPILYIALIATTIAQSVSYSESITDDFATYDEGDAGGSDYAPLPVDLPWDVEITDADTIVDESFEEAGWEYTVEEGPSYLGYDNPETGCTVWYDYGELDPSIDVTAGDREASISYLGFLAGAPVDPASVDDYVLTTDDWVDQGQADAVVAGTASADGSTTVTIARAFSGIGEGVFATVSCPDAATLETTLNELPDLLSIALY
ncbi:hypothetical protein [Agromyces sp. LHK192]|uniref:hypothetical protein n=1 Tax=Agromyces sp. LHK192 TaxID=2498704 RepID=UPI000FD752F6|nr:hypothetical protein [Agromyces sp. LHK192]